MPTIRPTSVLLGLLLCSCATQGIRVPVMKPAAVNLVQFDTVAVDRFEGDGATVFSDELAAALRNSPNPLTGKPAFEVMQRRDLDRALDEIRDRHGADWDRATMQALERWRTAQIVLNGHVCQDDVRDEIADEATTDRDGRRCLVHVRRATASVRVDLQASDVEGKRVFDKTVLSGAATACTRAEHGDPPPIDHGQLRAQARAQVVAEYLQRVLPHQVFVDVALYQDKDFPDLQVGNGYAEAGNWQQALAAYRRALETMTGAAGEYRYQALYNIGVACEFSDRFDEARQALQEAYALGRDSMILAELRRTDAREQEVQRLQQQGDKPATPLH
jgi:tetratricopeptide (TPR) repeat protein